jgi:hypothetical protein
LGEAGTGARTLPTLVPSLLGCACT